MTTAPPITIKTEGSLFVVWAPWKLLDLCLAIPGGICDNHSIRQMRTWRYPATPETAVALSDAFVGRQPVTDAEFDRLVVEGRPVDTAADEEMAWLLDYIKECGPPPLVKTKSWQHQVIGYYLAKRRPATMLNHDMGTGKSKTLIDIVVNLECQRTLIVCPKSVLAVWPAEFEKHAARPVRMVMLETGTVAKRAAQAELAIKLAKARKEQLVLVVNYEAVWRPPMANMLTGRRWDLIVCDESQHIKSAKGQASKYMYRLGRCADRRICLTGEAMPHSPLDAFGQYRFLDPTIFGTWWTLFKAKYTWLSSFRPPGCKQDTIVLGFRDLADFNRRFYSIAHRVEKRDVLDLPPVLHETRYVELGTKAARVYRDLEKDFIAQVEAGIVTASNALVKIVRLLQVTSGFVRLDTEETNGEIIDVTIDDKKALALTELLNDIPPAEPVIVVCQFHHDLDVVLDVVEKAGRKSFELSGRLKKRIAPQNLADWQAACGGEVLVLTMKTGKEGIDLTRAAYVVYFSMVYDGGSYQQSLARVDRSGQTRSTTYFHLIARGTIDGRVREALEMRRNIVQHVLTLAQPKGDDECMKPTPQIA